MFWFKTAYLYAFSKFLSQFKIVYDFYIEKCVYHGLSDVWKVENDQSMKKVPIKFKFNYNVYSILF